MMGWRSDIWYSNHPRAACGVTPLQGATPAVRQSRPGGVLDEAHQASRLGVNGWLRVEKMNKLEGLKRTVNP
jgi:hypothetical protein